MIYKFMLKSMPGGVVRMCDGVPKLDRRVQDIGKEVAEHKVGGLKHHCKTC